MDIKKNYWKVIRVTEEKSFIFIFNREKYIINLNNFFFNVILNALVAMIN